VLILIVGLVYLLPEEQKERFRATGDDKTSQQRLLYWENGWEMMRDHPLDGVGFFNFVPYFERYYSEDMLYKKAELPHNIFIQVGTDAGFYFYC
jgi:O-antigen ligase